jgi:hypothetical protein
MVLSFHNPENIDPALARVRGWTSEDAAPAREYVILEAAKIRRHGYDRALGDVLQVSGTVRGQGGYSASPHLRLPRAILVAALSEPQAEYSEQYRTSANDP